MKPGAGSELSLTSASGYTAISGVIDTRSRTAGMRLRVAAGMPAKTVGGIQPRCGGLDPLGASDSAASWRGDSGYRVPLGTDLQHVVSCGRLSGCSEEQENCRECGETWKPHAATPRLARGPKYRPVCLASMCVGSRTLCDDRRAGKIVTPGTLQQVQASPLPGCLSARVPSSEVVGR
jgi:hypothetical protein